jgi:hypothetical protein
LILRLHKKKYKRATLDFCSLTRRAFFWEMTIDVSEELIAYIFRAEE